MGIWKVFMDQAQKWQATFSLMFSGISQNLVTWPHSDCRKHDLECGLVHPREEKMGPGVAGQSLPIVTGFI